MSAFFLVVIPDRSIEKRALPTTFTLEVYVVTDKAHHENFETLNAQVNYMALLVNSVSVNTISLRNMTQV